MRLALVGTLAFPGPAAFAADAPGAPGAKTVWTPANKQGFGTATGRRRDWFTPNTFRTLGRAWPIFAGERVEYALAAGRPAGRNLRAMAGAANRGLLIPEQVWDGRPPTGRPGFRLGEAPARPPRWPGRTPSSCASRGPSTPAARSKRPRWWPAATPAAAAEHRRRRRA